ncbi:transglutaminase-like cysteine peptidase [Pacificispira sp.]|uniref:transglutaminase-like cysteine peptidase n=1 Tax=Pacificispira sp. TaxID=2888761 RepID=UPI003BAD9BAD
MLRRKPFLMMAAAVAALLVAPVLSAPDAHAAGVNLFGTKEISSTKLDKFEKWTGVLDRYGGEKGTELSACQITATEPCHIAKWRIFLNKLKGHPPVDQLQYVNKYLNQYAYILDPINYGKKDYWATPREFMYRTGDCEDYAISKYVSLIHLGWPKEQMRVVVLQDLNLNTPHAILVVYIDNQALVLDNQIPQVIDASRIKHYKPIFSINEDRWWLHRG